RFPTAKNSRPHLFLTDRTEMKRGSETGSPHEPNEVGRGGGEERPPKRRSFCPLGENKQNGRESDEVQVREKISFG
ncbi:MAG: hypothetical protein RSA86_04630, partial [Christensenellaceae bacterium]